MTVQTNMFEKMWEAGYNDCIRCGGFCGYKPCNVAQGVNCCKDCPTKCGNPCKRCADKKGARR